MSENVTLEAGVEASIQTAIAACASAIDAVLDLTSRAHSPLEMRECIDRVRVALEAFPANEKFLEDYQDRLLTHHFANGLYAREAILEKGTLGVTAIHEEQNISVMAKGKIAVITENGHQILEGPKVFTTPSGTRRFILVLEDTLFVTVHPNPENMRDTAALVARITAKDFAEMASAFDSISTVCGGEA